MDNNIVNIVTIVTAFGFQFSMGLIVLLSLLKGIKFLKNHKWL